MGRRELFYCLVLLLPLAESSSRLGSGWLLNLGAETSVELSWTSFSASIFVLVALVLSTYLIFEHLGAYNQPEVHPTTLSVWILDIYVVLLLFSLFLVQCFSNSSV